MEFQEGDAVTTSDQPSASVLPGRNASNLPNYTYDYYDYGGNSTEVPSQPNPFTEEFKYVQHLTKLQLCISSNHRL